MVVELDDDVLAGPWVEVDLGLGPLVLDRRADECCHHAVDGDFDSGGVIVVAAAVACACPETQGAAGSGNRHLGQSQCPLMTCAAVAVRQQGPGSGVRRGLVELPEKLIAGRFGDEALSHSLFEALENRVVLTTPFRDLRLVHAVLVGAVVHGAGIVVIALSVRLTADVYVPAFVAQTVVFSAGIAVPALRILFAAVGNGCVATGGTDALVFGARIGIVAIPAAPAAAVRAAIFACAVRLAGFANTVFTELVLLVAVFAAGCRACACLVAHRSHLADAHRRFGIATPRDAAAILAGSLVALGDRVAHAGL